MKKLIISILIFTFLITLLNCKNEVKIDNITSTSALPVKDEQSENKKLLTYKIQDKEKHETNNKAQLKIYAYLTVDPTTKEQLKDAVNNIYIENKNEGGYNRFSSPTVIAIYLFTSEKMAKEMHDQWIAMLLKGPDDIQPRILINDLKFESQSSLKDNDKSKDEIELERLTNYLQQRGLELCSFYKRMDDMELECIHKADAKYPDFGIKHSEYSEKLMDDERKKLKKKYNISEDTFTEVAVFGLSYCK